MNSRQTTDIATLSVKSFPHVLRESTSAVLAVKEAELPAELRADACGEASNSLIWFAGDLTPAYRHLLICFIILGRGDGGESKE